jgi:hypothetical protein
MQVPYARVRVVYVAEERWVDDVVWLRMSGIAE